MAFPQVSTSLVLMPMDFMEESSRLQFSLKIAQNLDEENFLLWCQQIEPYINMYGLTKFVVCTCVPLKFVNDETHTIDSVKPQYS